MHTILVLGGYGFFGKRISASLALEPSIRVLVGGRRRDKAIATCVALGLPESGAVEVDTCQADLTDLLSRLGVGTLIHAAGPFQGQDYRIARAAIAARCNYIDLADARQFVAGISELDAAALAGGVLVASGASSVPALSSAVVDRYAPLFGRLDSIRIGISSAARAPGLATVRGVFGYCGKPIARWERGHWSTTWGWLDLHRHRFPAPVGSRLLGSCDVPDLALFPQRYAGVKTVRFHAGFASAPGHLAVWGLAGLVKSGLLPGLVPFASALSGISRWIEPIASDSGAMFVELEGLDHQDRPMTRTWNLIASRNDGPNIPCGPSIALARKLAAGNPLPRGAMPCMGLLDVDDCLAALRDLAIREIPP